MMYFSVMEAAETIIACRHLTMNNALSLPLLGSRMRNYSRVCLRVCLTKYTLRKCSKKHLSVHLGKDSSRRVTLGGTRVRAKHTRWRFSQHSGRDRTLNKKQTAISVVKGATQITLKTQRMIPAPRRKKRRQEPWLLIMGM